MSDGGGDGGSGVDRLLARLGVWRDDEDAAAAAMSLRRRHWLRQQAAESTTLTGILLNLAERELPVTIGTMAGPQRGTITSVTAALCALDLGGPDGGRALIPVGAITAVDGPVGFGRGDIADSRIPANSTDLAAALGELAAEPIAVAVHLIDGTTVTGTLATVGADVVSLRVRAGSATIHVSLGSIVACVVDPGTVLRADPALDG